MLFFCVCVCVFFCLFGKNHKRVSRMSESVPPSSGATTASAPDFALLDGNTAKWSLEDDANLVKILSQI